MLFRRGRCALLFCVLVSACKPANPAPIAKCEQVGAVNVRVGDAVLRIPSRIIGVEISKAGDRFEINKPRSPELSRACPEDYSGAPEAQSILIRSPGRNKLNENTLSIAVNLKISKAGPEFHSLYGIRDWNNFELQPAVSNFVTTGSAMVGAASSDLFIYQGEGAEMSPGEPLTIACYKEPAKLEDDCFTWFELSQGVSVEYSFKSSEYPISEWISLHRAVRDELAPMLQR